jgi:cytochrome b
MTVVAKPVSRAAVMVWDPLVRYGHWALVLAFAIAYISAEEESSEVDLLHVWGGYTVGVIVLIRAIWGFIGPAQARFSNFVCGPDAAARYLFGLIRGNSPRYLGHSPAGGAMVVALLVFLAATVATGLVAYGDRGKGPLAGVQPPAITASAFGEQRADMRDPARGGEEAESLIGELHGVLANITLALVIAHVLGVGLASFVHHENLVGAMITGQKRAED